ncbi:uncharacterized protein TRUGW13939_05972 [Talaromyces rugulosus]|uniref:Uncharacterized protein n=1 Tax=Talaromyces rugulosus TaxID=121627 RepID=A0A7H8QXL0_TALRU|nr:uncharacterized protein TRUGW13939_05972 [Talaromyces rugulosus]QKX58844.1 hypothetical protein TRUGW13939_05972 [Talaromyces rugulosus]
MSLDYHGLFGLSALTNQYEYGNSRQFLSIVNQELGLFMTDHKSRSEYIIFTGVDGQTFRRDFLNRDGPADFETYSITHQLILFKMESHTHGIAHRSFDHMLHDKLRDMGNGDRQIRPFGSAHVQGEERKKRADESYQPNRLPRHRSNHWPSLVVEVGYSEVQRKLESDVAWWSTESAGDVRAVITIAVDPRVKRMIICQWHGTNMVYRNVLSRPYGGRMQNTNSNPLVIEFDRLFLRAPQGIEANITFTIDELGEFAELVWEIEFEGQVSGDSS